MVKNNLLRFLSKLYSKWSTLLKVFFLFFMSLIYFEMYLLFKSKDFHHGMYVSSFDSEFDDPQIESNSSPSSGQWQQVMGTRYKFYVYSAHYDSRLEPQIRIIGVTRAYNPDKVYCQLFYEDGKSEYVYIPATVKAISDNSGAPFTTVIVTCPLPDSEVPWSVAVVSASLPIASSHLKVHKPEPQVNGSPTIAACIRPIENHNHQIFRLIEFIEMNTLLGISHFMFYNQSMTKEVGCMLSDYAKQGRVTVLPWNLLMWNKNLKKIQEENIYAAFHDCVYRTMYKYTYSTFLSLDEFEFIVPRNMKTLQEFIESKGSQLNMKTGAFSFANAYFYLEWPDEMWNRRNIVGYMMTTFKTYRTSTDFEEPPHSHVTYLFRPESVLEIGTHKLILVPGSQLVKVEQSEAMCHKYQLCERSSVDCTNLQLENELTMRRFSDSLNSAMKSQWNRAMPVCSLQDEPGVLTKPMIVLRHNVLFLI